MIQLLPEARAAWRRGKTVMTGPLTLYLPHWPTPLWNCWIEAPDPETHRVAEITRRMAGPEWAAYLDEIDALLWEEELVFV